MVFRSGFIVFLTMLMAACGDGGGDGGDSQAPAELTGVFQGGNVWGLHYRTPTRSGETDATGAFHYLAGETVVFSIGAIQVGSAPGAPTISPFTLAGLAVPSTEAALRLELGRAARSATPFVRAVNIARLLLALDMDSNATNGIDLRAREGLLVNAALDLGGSMPRFAAQLDRLTVNLTRNIPNWAPVVHLYRAVNVSVPAHAMVRGETMGGFLVPGAMGISTTSHDANGLQEHTTLDREGDGVLEEDTRRTYDSLGRQLTSHQLRSDFILFRFAQTSNATYDGFGNLLRSVHDLDMGLDDTIDSRSVIESEFDAFGRMRTSLQTGDNGLNGVDYRSNNSFTYDARGNPQTLVQLLDTDGDGDVDERVHETLAYDAMDRPVSRLYEEDFDADGVIDSRQSLSVTWASGGRVVTQVNTTDQDADGTPDFSSTTVWSYDAAARLSSFTYENDAGADGSVEYREWAQMEHDAEGRELRNAQSHDFDGDGIADSAVVLNREYDNLGNETSVTQESDFDADGVPDWRSVETRHFGGSGELLDSRYETDSGADGSVDMVSTSTFTNVSIAAGVAMLAQQYFEGGGFVYVSAGP